MRRRGEQDTTVSLGRNVVPAGGVRYAPVPSASATVVSSPQSERRRGHNGLLICHSNCLIHNEPAPEHQSRPDPRGITSSFVRGLFGGERLREERQIISRGVIFSKWVSDVRREGSS